MDFTEAGLRPGQFTGVITQTVSSLVFVEPLKCVALSFAMNAFCLNANVPPPAGSKYSNGESVQKYSSLPTSGMLGPSARVEAPRRA